jgi:hypothetical protein
MSWRTGHPLIQTPFPVPCVSLDHVAGVWYGTRDVPPPICQIHSSEDIKQTCMLAKWTWMSHVGLDCTSRTRDT